MAAPTRNEVDPRIERSRRAILGASLAELEEHGYGAFTIESVAARAGVGKSTIYRHWRDKLDLIADAFETLHEENLSNLESGSARQKIERILEHVAEVVADSPFSRCIPALVDAAERDPRLRRFHHEFQSEARRPLTGAIADGVASGELPSRMQPELAASALLGAIFFRRLMTPTPLEPGRAGELLDVLLGPEANESAPPFNDRADSIV